MTDSIDPVQRLFTEYMTQRYRFDDEESEQLFKCSEEQFQAALFAFKAGFAAALDTVAEKLKEF